MSIHHGIFLGLDTSYEHGLITLFDAQQIYFEKQISKKFSHAQSIAPLMKEALDLLEINKQNLAGVAVGIGPGSFVGIRIALATALGFCLARSLPLLAVCSHEALALSAQASKKELLVLMKASGNLFYATKFKHKKDSLMKSEETSIVDLEALLKISDANVNIVTDQPLVLSKGSPIFGPSAHGFKETFFRKLKITGILEDESELIKPNYIKSVSARQS